MVKPDFLDTLGQAIVIVLTVGIDVDLHYIRHFSVNKCQHFKVTGLALWRVLSLTNTFNSFPSVYCGRG